MKKIFKNIISLLGLILISSACSDDFLEVKDTNRVNVENWYQTIDDFTLALNSCYSYIGDGGLYGLQMQLKYNTWDNRILFESDPRDRFLDMSPSNGDIGNMWRALYFGLYRTTVFIQKISEKTAEEIEGMPNEATRLSLLAQAQTLRASAYFYLVTMFDKPVFYDEISLPADPTIDLGNGNQIQFYDKIVADCEAALPHLPAKSELSVGEYGRMTKGICDAILGKAMLYKHYYYHCRFGSKGSAQDIADLEKGKAALGRVIADNSSYQLSAAYDTTSKKDYLYAMLSNFAYIDLPLGDNIYDSENNKESVWEVNYTDTRIAGGWLPAWQWSGALNAQYFSTNSGSYKNHEIHPNLYDKFETVASHPAGFTRDPRVNVTCFMDGDTMDFRPGAYNKKFSSITNTKRIASSRGLTLPAGTRALGLKKYYFPVYNENVAPLNDPINVRIIRLADVLLMYAETEFLLNGNTADGLSKLNLVRKRAGMPPVAELTTEVIKHEREVELATESGLHFFDMVRWSFDPAWGINWNVEYPGTDLQGPFVVGRNEFLPIPQSEIDLSEGLLKQNNGY